MLIMRPSYARGLSRSSWLTSYHTFSFADYYDPIHRGFRSLCVMNQDIIQPGAGFDKHPHKDMEILTYVISGAIIHKDSMNNETIIRPGEIQCMSAGMGITHSEYNASTQEPVTLLQIWIIPKQKGLMPSYQQINLDINEKGLQLLGSEEGELDSVIINQSIKLWRGHLEEGRILNYKIAPQRHCWLQLIKGELVINNHLISAGDGVAISDESKIEICANQISEFLLFDLT